MKLEKITIMSSVALIFLGIAVWIVAYNYIGQGAKDIKSCKKFVENLYSIGAVKEYSEDKYERKAKNTNSKELAVKSITNKTYGFDLDANNNVIGFIRKDIEKANMTKINSNEAKELSLKYLNEIYGKKVVLKRIEKNEGKNKLPYYSFIYSREKNGYAFYFDEIKVNINKENGLLDGYSNSTLQKECKKNSILISKEQASQNGLNYFLKSNKYGAIKDNEIELYYVDNAFEKNSNGQCELCYIITVDGKDVKDKSTTWKIFVNVETGNIVNSIKDESENQVEID